jgi:hypothetical protein
MPVGYPGFVATQRGEASHLGLNHPDSNRTDFALAAEQFVRTAVGFKNVKGVPLQKQLGIGVTHKAGLVKRAFIHKYLFLTQVKFLCNRAKPVGSICSMDPQLLLTCITLHPARRVQGFTGENNHKPSV